MTSKELEFILALAEVVFKDGIPAVIDVINAWKVDDPTLEDINKLHDLVPRPSDTE